MGVRSSAFKVIQKISEKQQKNFFNHLENTHLAVCLYNEKGVISYINDIWLLILGEKRTKKFHNKSVFDVSDMELSPHPEFQPFYLQETKSVLMNFIEEIR
ncbi:hypothetical protein M0812_17964 [Anaeramoeba flamelloides]|uniref:Uncharacterized protein n=1 Tax=Anaeramoeba flamelloides TaxID=1746091 RepID=A0AAV7Z4U9_9EUKA|nr:hypothetical protein M0812_17964 [Anaeramoeba flamelloides]